MMIENYLKYTSDLIFRKCESFTKRRNWILLLSVSLPFLILCLAFPSYERINTEFEEGWKAIIRQASNPFVNHTYGEGSHENNLTFRLTMPILANIFHLGIVGILVFQALVGISLFFLSTKLFERITKDKISALLLTFSIAFIYAGKVSFIEIRGMFDGLALFFLVFSMYFNNPVLIFIGIYLSSWTDERGLIASSIVFLYYIYLSTSYVNKLFNKQTLSIILAWVAYFVTRLLMQKYFGLEIHPEFFKLKYYIEQFNNLPIGVWSALEGNWIIIVLSLFVLFKHKKYLFLFSYSFTISLVLFVAMSVFDITRSMAYIFPALFLSLILIKEVEDVVTIRKIVLIVTILSFAYPAYYSGGDYYIGWTYPFPLQILRHLFASGS